MSETETEAQQLAAAKEKLGITALERAMTNLIQELQARNGMAPATTSSQGRGGMAGIIENGLSLVVTALSKFQPQANNQVDLVSRLLDMTLNHYAVIDQVFLKSAGVNITPPVQHMTVVH